MRQRLKSRRTHTLYPEAETAGSGLFRHHCCVFYVTTSTLYSLPDLYHQSLSDLLVVTLEVLSFFIYIHTSTKDQLAKMYEAPVGYLLRI